MAVSAGFWARCIKYTTSVRKINTRMITLMGFLESLPPKRDAVPPGTAWRQYAFSFHTVSLPARRWYNAGMKQLYQRLRHILGVILRGPHKEALLIYAMGYADLNAEYTGRPDGLSFRELNAETCAVVSDIRGPDMQGKFGQMIARGEKCVAACMDGKPIAYAACAADNKGAYIHDCYVAPEYRGRGVYPRMLADTIKKVHDERGCARFTIAADPGNHASQRGILKAGFTLAGRSADWSWGRLHLLEYNGRRRIYLSKAARG